MQIGDYKVTRLDARFNGHRRFVYMIKPFILFPIPAKNKSLFVLARNWCWQQWGPSTELNLMDAYNPQWVWETTYNKLRIYLKSDEELALFILTFSG